MDTHDALGAPNQEPLQLSGNGHKDLRFLNGAFQGISPGKPIGKLAWDWTNPWYSKKEMGMKGTSLLFFFMRSKGSR